MQPNPTHLPVFSYLPFALVTTPTGEKNLFVETIVSQCAQHYAYTAFAEHQRGRAYGA